MPAEVPLPPVEAVRLVIVVDAGIIVVGEIARLEIAFRHEAINLLKGRENDRVRGRGERTNDAGRQ